jgi:D-psicose/D-tagatose/L-ribulose 3-epimerase
MANAIGIHLSFWQTQWSDNLLPLIGRAKKAGFEVAEFPLLQPTDLDFPALRRELDRLEMLASCSTGLGPDTDITDPDPEIRERGLDHLYRCLEGASLLGSPLLGGVTYAPWAVFPDSGLEERRENCIRSLRKAAKRAEDLGITLCMEVLNRFEGYLINTVAQAAEIIREVGSPNLKIQLDTFHLNIEADSLGEEIRRAGTDLGHFHCVANNRKPPGAGHIPWDEVRAALKAVDYQGYLVAETFVSPLGEVGRGLFIWRTLADDLDTAARQAADFIRERIL